MSKRVLVPVDMNSVSEASIGYGIELAARIRSSVSLIAISSAKSTDSTMVQEIAREWRDRAVSESQNRAVTLEIFVTSGDFFREVIRFLRSQPAVQFIVLGLPGKTRGDDDSRFVSQLKRLHEEFDGEILLVEKAGHITRIFNRYLHHSVKGISV